MANSIIGQEKILDKLNSYTLQTLPRTLLFLGEVGSGRHTLINYITEKFNLARIELTEDFLISNFDLPVIPTMYIIDLDLFTEKQQNQFLKFIEEPSNFAYIALIARSDINILSTVLNRCLKLPLAIYTKSQLKEICPIASDLGLQLNLTPGNLKTVDFKQLDQLYSLVESFLKNIKSYSLVEYLKQALLLNYKENYNKYDYTLFLKLILYISYNIYSTEKNILYLRIYIFTTKCCQELLYKNIDKNNFILNYLINLKEIITHES